MSKAKAEYYGYKNSGGVVPYGGPLDRYVFKIVGEKVTWLYSDGTEREQSGETPYTAHSVRSEESWAKFTKPPFAFIKFGRPYQGERDARGRFKPKVVHTYAVGDIVEQLDALYSGRLMLILSLAESHSYQARVVRPSAIDYEVAGNERFVYLGEERFFRKFLDAGLLKLNS